MSETWLNVSIIRWVSMIILGFGMGGRGRGHVMCAVDILVVGAMLCVF